MTYDTDDVIEQLIGAVNGAEWEDPDGLSPVERAIRQLQDMRHQIWLSCGRCTTERSGVTDDR